MVFFNPAEFNERGPSPRKQKEALDVPKIIQYQNGDFQAMKVKISMRFNTCVLCTDEENYIISKGKRGLWNQSLLTHLRGRCVLQIHSQDDNFIFVASKGSDNNLTLMNDFQPQFRIRINRGI